jgi:hypothetical protein
MQIRTDADQRGLLVSQASSPGHAIGSFIPGVLRLAHTLATSPLLRQLAVVFLAYLVAGKLGQATTNIRSSNLGPVWPAFGIALAAFLAFGYRVWPGIAASAFIIAAQGSVPVLAATGQAIGATMGAAGAPSFFAASPRSIRRSRDCVMPSG